MEKTSGSARIQSVDALRGAIIIIMALDHVRDFTSIAAMSFSPTDLSRTTAALFFTRWITHFCAPVFAFTAGIGTFFWYHRGRTLQQLSRFLLTRGLWLMFLELTSSASSFSFSGTGPARPSSSLFSGCWVCAWSFSPRWCTCRPRFSLPSA